MSNEANIAQKAPYATEVEEGKTYYWCACGRSKSQPFCDGSHQGTNHQPIGFTAAKTGAVYLCGCKHSGNKPYCDGTHQNL